MRDLLVCPSDGFDSLFGVRFATPPADARGRRLMAAPNMPTPHEAVLSRLKRVKSAGAGKWMAECPVHNDGTQSLSVGTGKDGRVLLYCQAQCATSSVVEAIGLTVNDLFVPGTEPTKPAAQSQKTTRTLAMVKSYDYTDANGALLFQSLRLVDNATGKKTFRQRQRTATGGWEYNLDDVEPVLYRLPDVLSAVESGRTVFVVEGEKDADNLAELGYTATTNPMGAGKWRESMSLVLHGADVVIFPDNDEPGRSHAEQVAASLVTQDATVKVVALPGLPEKGDVSDWLDAGGDLDALSALIGATPRWTGDALQQQHRTRWRLDELLENDAIMRPPPIIVPRLAWAGRSTLLAAREKAGKSTLAGYVTAAVANGARFLGDPCQRGTVLIIGLEEFIGDTARRLREFHADPTRVHLVSRFAGTADLHADELSAHIAAVDPVLVIVDSLSAYSQGLVNDDNSATEMTAVMQPLTNAAHESGSALILIHHTTKATGKSRGSTAITAGVDMVCEFDIPKEETDPTLRRMRSVGRFPVPRLYEIRFDGNDYVLATGMEAPIDERILAVVTNRPSCTGQDVVDALAARRQDVLARITLMLADGRLKNQGTGHILRLIVPGHTLNPLL
jgi:putative DNA primase/helicase